MERTLGRADVIVVGAGPVGMTLALLLASQGLRVVIVERRTTSSDEPKAISLDDEALRVYQNAGVVDQVLSIIVPGTGTMYYDANDQPILHARAPHPFRYSYPFKNPFAQPDLERVLWDAMVDHPLIELRSGTSVVDLVQDDAGVTVTTDHEGIESTIRGSYAVGADGGRSTVRALVGIGMQGRSFDDVWVVVDTVGDSRHERFGMHHGDPRRPHVVVPGLDGRCRYEFYTFPGEADPDRVPDFDLIARMVAPYRQITPADLERAVAYRFHALNAIEWRSDRVFLTGDAAHMMPPFAGQGLNSGVRDAVNLAWKLTHAVRHPQDDHSALLDSYQSERRPHAQAVIDSSVRLGRVVMTTNERLAQFRDAKIRAAIATPEGRDFFERMRYRPTARIEQGIVLLDPTDPAVGTQLAQPAVFDLRGHRIVPLDDLLGPGWSVLCVGLDGDDAAAVSDAFADLGARVVAVPLDDLIGDYPDDVDVAIDLDGRLYDELQPQRGRYVLVRPDRFIAASWTPAESDAVLDRLRGILPTSHTSRMTAV